MRDVLLPCDVCRGLLPAGDALRVRDAPLQPHLFLHWACFDGWMRRLVRAPALRSSPLRSPGAQPLEPRFAIRDS